MSNRKTAMVLLKVAIRVDNDRSERVLEGGMITLVLRQ